MVAAGSSSGVSRRCTGASRTVIGSAVITIIIRLSEIWAVSLEMRPTTVKTRENTIEIYFRA